MPELKTERAIRMISATMRRLPAMHPQAASEPLEIVLHSQIGFEKDAVIPIVVSPGVRLGPQWHRLGAAMTRKMEGGHSHVVTTQVS